MSTFHTKMLVGVLAMGLLSAGALAAEETVYGSQLMTNQERVEQRAKMNAAKTAEEREQVRAEHHDKMQARAKERGVTLPEVAPAQGVRAAPRGPGMGPRDGRGRQR